MWALFPLLQEGTVSEKSPFSHGKRQVPAVLCPLRFGPPTLGTLLFVTELQVRLFAGVPQSEQARVSLTEIQNDSCSDFLAGNLWGKWCPTHPPSWLCEWLNRLMLTICSHYVQPSLKAIKTWPGQGSFQMISRPNSTSSFWRSVNKNKTTVSLSAWLVPVVQRLEASQ